MEAHIRASQSALAIKLTVQAESLTDQAKKQMEQGRPPARHGAGQKAPHRADKGPRIQTVNHPAHRRGTAPVARLGTLAAFLTLKQDLRKPEQGQQGLGDQPGHPGRRDQPALRKERPALRLGRLPADQLEPLREPPLGRPLDRWPARQELQPERRQG